MDNEEALKVRFFLRISCKILNAMQTIHRTITIRCGYHIRSPAILWPWGQHRIAVAGSCPVPCAKWLREVRQLSQQQATSIGCTPPGFPRFRNSEAKAKRKTRGESSFKWHQTTRHASTSHGIGHFFLSASTTITGLSCL